MKTLIRQLFPALIILMLLSGQLSAKKDVLFSINGNEVTKEEFLYIYNKNNPESDNPYSEERINEYLELYINFKLKVQDAKSKGLDTTAEYEKDLEGYREQLMKPYLKDVDVTDQLIEEAIERSRYEVNASHILIMVDREAPPADTLKAFKKIQNIRKEIEAGADFAEMAASRSEDPSAKHNKGELGYFTTFEMVYPFETAVYNLEVGEISEPVRTAFGYHLVKLNDKRKARGKIEVAHILVSDEAQNRNETLAKAKIDSIYQLLQKGEDFADLVAKYSDDRRTSQSGGRLPPFESLNRNVPVAFLDAAFALEQDGAISEPVKTDIGWHIIQRKALIKPEVPATNDFEIRRKIERDSRSQLGQEAAVSRLKKENNLRERRNPLRGFDRYADSTLLDGKWTINPDNVRSRRMFRIGSENFNQQQFAAYLLKNQTDVNHDDLDFYLHKHYQSFINKSVLQYEKDNLEAKYPEFRNLLREYRDGILLFEITDQKVWSKASADTAGLKAFYENNIDNYMWDTRIKGGVFVCRTEKLSSEVSNHLEESEEMTAEAIFIKFNEKDPLSLEYKSGAFELKDKPFLKELTQKDAGIYQINEADTYYVVKLEEVLEPKPKELSEIRGRVIADYQDYLEKKWVNSLRERYQVNINQSVLNQIIR